VGRNKQSSNKYINTCGFSEDIRLYNCPGSHVETAGGLIGVIIAVVIVLALPTIGLILWKRKNSNSSNPGSIGFENSTYQYDTKQENGQFVAEQNSTETES
jgi:hypothetical protein